MKPFVEALRNEVVVIDGATGSFLMEQGLEPGSPPEVWNLAHPERIQNMHRLYLKAGARLITANTFNATRLRMAEWKLDPVEVNRRGVEVALRVADGKAWVFGSVGPLGKFISPLGELSFDEARATYVEQVRILVESGVHGLIVETVSDLKEMRAALTAAREVFDGPVIAQMTFGADGRTVTGSPPEATACVVTALRATVGGANCGLGPDRMLAVMERYAAGTSLPLVAQPNAGVPELKAGRPVYPASAEEMAGYAAKFVEAGCVLVGSCCGSTPDHTRAIAARVAGMKPVPRRRQRGVAISSRTRWLVAGAPRPFVVVGERINPSGKPGLSAELRKGSMRLLREEAIGQTGRGAHCLDLNVSVPDTDEAALMSAAAQAVEKVADVPVFVDSMNADAIEQALKTLPGRCVINSVPAQKKRLEILLPLAAKYGCAIVALALGETGVAESAKSRLELLETVLREAQKHGLTEDDVLFDPTILTVSTAGAHVRETLEALRLIRERGWASVLGVSNVSFGMPQRSLLNASLLSMAMAQGLDAAFLNPHDERVRDALLAASALVRDDAAGKKYAAAFSAAAEAPRRPDETAAESGQRRPATPAEALEQALVRGEKEDAVKAAELLLKAGESVTQVIEEHLVPAMRRIGERFETGEIFLPHIVMSAEAAQGIFTLLSSRQKGVTGLKGKIVIATVEGDVHDIGKNLVAMMLRTHGYEVFDLGKSVLCEDIAAKAEEVGADVVAMSALLTTTMPRMEDVARLLRERKLSSRVLVGGAPVSREYAARIGATYAPNAVEAVKSADALTR